MAVRRRMLGPEAKDEEVQGQSDSAITSKVARCACVMRAQGEEFGSKAVTQTRTAIRFGLAGAFSMSNRRSLSWDLILDTIADAIAAKLEARTQQRTRSFGPRLLTVTEAAQRLGRSKYSIQHMIASGKLPVVRADRRVFLDASDLEHWIEANKQASI